MQGMERCVDCGVKYSTDRLREHIESVQVALPGGDAAAHSEAGVAVQRGKEDVGLGEAAAVAQKGAHADVGAAITTV